MALVSIDPFCLDQSSLRWLQSGDFLTVILHLLVILLHGRVFPSLPLAYLCQCVLMGSFSVQWVISHYCIYFDVELVLDPSSGSLFKFQVLF